MQTPSRLQTLLRRDAPLLGTLALAVLNGLPITPLHDSVSYILYLFTRGSRILDQDLMQHLASLLIAMITLLLAGIPAALYERLRGLKRSTPVSLGIWLVATALLALPALATILDLR